MGSSPKCRLLLPVFLWACAILHTGLSVDLELRDKTATQSSTYYAPSLGIDLVADRALDGDISTISHTLCSGNQWWRVDLEAAYCLTRIAVVNINVNGDRLRGAIVRAGLSLTHSQNTQIGDEVTSTQATNGAVIDFTSNQAISARYVSVEQTGTCLQLAEVRIGTEDVITSVTQTNVDATGMTVSWSSVPCADYYSVQYALTNKDNCESISSPTYSSPCNMCLGSMTTIYSLMPNSGYTVRVKAHVYGAYGPIKTVTVTTASSAPTGPPTSVTPGSQAQRSLTFSWSLPACGSRGGVITGYDYRLSTSGVAPMTGQTTASLSGGAVTIDGLTPSTSYSFQVAARTNDGTGPYSAAVTSTTQEAEPTVPLNVRIQSTDYMSVSLSWSEPDPPNGRITHYSVRYWRSGDMGTMLTDTNVMWMMHRVTSLQVSSTYQFQVQAVTSAGPGPWSEPIQATTAIGVPGAIRNLLWTERTETSITLEWSPPIVGYIVGYTVEYRILERPYDQEYTAEDTYITEDIPSARFVKDDLEPGTKYEFKISAKNDMFTGDPRTLQVYTKPQSDPPAPPKPTSIQDTTTDMTVTIQLAIPKSNKYIESHVIEVKKTGTLSVTKRDVLVPRRYEDSVDDYIAAEFPKNSLPAEFVVGDSTMYGGYRNAPLQRDAVYNIRVGSVTKGNETDATVTYSESLTVIVQTPSAGAAVIAAAVLGAIVFVLVLMIVIGCVVWKRRTRQNASNSSLVPTAMELAAKSTTHENDSLSAVNTNGQIYEDVGLPAWARKLEIKWENLIIDDEILGKGNFGEVRAGGVRIRGRVTEAAIKTLKDSTSDAAMDFKAELQTMAGIKPHLNIVRLLGACFHEGILYVALEFLPNGNLRDYLRSTRPKQKGAGDSTDLASPLTSSNLLKFGTDVAKGMDHLSKTGIIHRDLAARNILLAEDLTAKVSDFGLSRGEDIYVQKSSTRIPVRWMAIESLTRRVYKSKSDVWSFGILLWEIATYGSTPYPGIVTKSLAQRLLDGYRMPKPDNCADEIYNLMLKCWQEVPSKRPTFKVLYDALEKMNSQSDEIVYLSPTVYENFIIKHEFDDN
ncbi:angiopoietin-1 receptor-like [Patiria miniata]|uniref:receptor protein-tyrosine kinase n=1 Tax=Patiria miniata TaxID=46514 RepID=A0A914AT75_PATMI|nr:angiopoietin-1 receptor-like [Patiria miniata]